ncbi:hypothetical protein [Flavobacterium johnsoniae]|jgi:hypothetical protein|uniref:Uncharacterized protein n=2 Tax=Flavobacterium johnsoniae TaxID=986 RepID=A5FG00_FLAJ1|nr:hypothetical protein [Flavobacterium johnsoniae]ABQ05865.1 hypothetical protein Fjoh_2843 [Flavobacterium johnsoniae UW101]WQG81601.1 hypothetical protein SR927_00580 [Flavobacterium johnsoniae UW101]SHK58384.1 hypothetical protein SAMN05444146_1561 [Flavobacterium johnsoniae]
MIFNLNFTTDYGQFYLNDKDEGDTGSENFWSDQALNDKLAVEKGILGVSIENTEGMVKCELEILNSKSLISDFSSFDHVVEASLEIKTGILQVNDCPFSIIVLEEKIEIGNYRVRVYFNNLKSAYFENPKDYYKIEMWKDVFSDRHVLKRFEN